MTDAVAIVNVAAFAVVVAVVDVVVDAVVAVNKLA